MNSNSAIESKKIHLMALSLSVLLELCLNHGVNTAFFRLETSTQYPQKDQMVEALLEPVV
jgi:hypothetical protein